jgi:hypothetical protein
VAVQWVIGLIPLAISLPDSALTLRGQQLTESFATLDRVVPRFALRTRPSTDTDFAVPSRA